MYLVYALFFSKYMESTIMSFACYDKDDAYDRCMTFSLWWAWLYGFLLLPWAFSYMLTSHSDLLGNEECDWNSLFGWNWKFFVEKTVHKTKIELK